jgi:hypothetical protein
MPIIGNKFYVSGKQPVHNMKFKYIPAVVVSYRQLSGFTGFPSARCMSQLFYISPTICTLLSTTK